MLNTAEEVGPSEIDKQGRYDPEARDAKLDFDYQLFHRVGGMEDGGFGKAGATGKGRPGPASAT